MLERVKPIGIDQNVIQTLNRDIGKTCQIVSRYPWFTTAFLRVLLGLSV